MLQLSEAMARLLDVSGDCKTTARKDGDAITECIKASQQQNEDAKGKRNALQKGIK